MMYRQVIALAELRSEPPCVVALADRQDWDHLFLRWQPRSIRASTRESKATNEVGSVTPAVTTLIGNTTKTGLPDPESTSMSLLGGGASRGLGSNSALVSTQSNTKRESTNLMAKKRQLKGHGSSDEAEPHEEDINYEMSGGKKGTKRKVQRPCVLL